MNSKLLTLALAIFASASISRAVLEWPSVDTTNNKVGLKYVEVCKFDPADAKIYCKVKEDNMLVDVNFDEVEVVEGSSTGTPPWLQYKEDYIGQTVGVDAHGVPGAGKRTIYLKK